MSDAFEAGSIKGGIDLDLATYARNIGIAIAESRRFENEFNGSMQKSQTMATAVGAAIGGVISAGINVAASAVRSLVGAFADTIVSGVQLAAQMEQTSISFEVMLGSADRAKKLLDEIEDFSASTPFEFPELANASRKLLAFGFAADEIVPKMRQLGDISAALQIPINDLADLYGKARTQGTLMAEDINQLTGRGIPIIAEFAKQFGVAESEVKKLGSEGKITFANLEAAIASMTSEGGQFAGITERQSQGMLGLASTLSDAWNTTKREIGEAIAGGEDGRQFLQDLSADLEDMKPAIVDLAKVAAEAIQGLLPHLKSGIELTTQLLAILSQTDQYKQGGSPYQRESARAGLGSLGANNEGLETAIRIGGGQADAANVLNKSFDAYRQTPQITTALDVSAPGLLDRQAGISQKVSEHTEAYNAAMADMGKMLEDQRNGIAVDPARFDRAKTAIGTMSDLVDQLREAHSQVAAAVSSSNIVTNQSIKDDVNLVQSTIGKVSAESDRLRGTLNNKLRDKKRAQDEATREANAVSTGTESDFFFDKDGNPVAGETPSGKPASNSAPAPNTPGKSAADPAGDWMSESVDAQLRADGKLQELAELEVRRWKAKEAEKVKTTQDRQALEEAAEAKLNEIRTKFAQQGEADAERQRAADQRTAEAAVREAQRAADEREQIAQRERDRLANVAAGFGNLRGRDRDAAYGSLRNVADNVTGPLANDIAANTPALSPAAGGGSVAAQVQAAMPQIIQAATQAAQAATNAGGQTAAGKSEQLLADSLTVHRESKTLLEDVARVQREIQRKPAITVKEVKF